MKKKLFFLAVAAVALASCSNDETIASQANSEANAISFRPLTTGITRAADANLTTTGFRVTATKTSDASTVYFKNVDFTSSTPATTFASATKYYWPSDYNLDFYAFAPIAAEVVGDGKQIVPTSDGSAYDANAYAKFKVTPDAAAANQVDFIYAKTNNWGKATGAASDHSIPTEADGVTINFRHTESKVLIKLYNSNSNIKVIVRDAAICNVNTSGVFTLAATNTDTKDAALLDGAQWTGQAGSDSYTVTDQSDTKYNVALESAAQVGADWILIPQTLTYATAYSGSEVGDGFTGSCIKINLKIKNNAGAAAYIVGADDDPEDANDNEGYVTAMWPLKSAPTAWGPGKKYTYTVDLAGGGYFPANTAAGTGTALDPILAGAEIKFVSVTVDDWTDEAGSVYTTGLPE